MCSYIYAPFLPNFSLGVLTPRVFVCGFLLYPVSVCMKICPCWICYECIQFQIEMRKVSCCSSRSSDNAEFGYFMIDWCFAEDGKEMQQELFRTCTAIILLIKPNLFGDVLVAVAVVFCLRSLADYHIDHLLNIAPKPQTIWPLLVSRRNAHTFTYDHWKHS